MPGWLKALLIIAIVIVLLVVGGIGAGAWWWMRNKDALLGGAQEGKEFGVRTDNQGCVTEGVTRYKKDPGITSAIATSIFMRTCLDASKPSPGFCDSVPGKTEFIKTAEWRREQCSKHGLGSDNYCQNIFQSVQEYCEHPGSSPANRNSNSP
jgi:hypothetical protein